MQNDSHYHHYTLAELRQLLSETDPRHSLERYARLQHEIEEREEELLAYQGDIAKVGREEGSGLLIIATLFVGFIYILPCYFGFLILVGGIASIRSGQIFELLVLPLVICISLVLLPVLGVFAMRWVLRSVTNKVAVKAWSLIAAGLAPGSSIVYLLVLDYVFALNNVTKFPITRDSIGLNLIFIVLGFYMPFVLFTFWLKYKYRQDEF